MRTLRLVTLAVAVAAGGGACATDPSPAPQSPAPVPAGPGHALACFSMPPADCDRVASEAIARLPAGRPPVVVVDVRDRLIDIEFADGGGRLLAEFGPAGDGRLEFGPWTESQVGGVRPVSGPAAGPIVAFTLGHCGLASPIDVDGSFWDAYGAIDGNPALINANDGQFRRLGPDEAEFVTLGSRVALRRHVGSKSLPGCD